jgi:ABC-type transport system substrate-binding protein
MDRAILGLGMLDPETLKLEPFIMANYTAEPWISVPALGITNGEKVSFYVRNDVDWYDGESLSAYDCIENMRVMWTYNPGRYDNTWKDLVYAELEGPNKFNCYFDTTGVMLPNYVSGSALLVPAHVIAKVEELIANGTITGIDDWRPGEVDAWYADLMGSAPPKYAGIMKQIVGCGPYIYDFYARDTATARVQRNEEFFIDSPAEGAVFGIGRTIQAQPTIMVGTCRTSALLKRLLQANGRT